MNSTIRLTEADVRNCTWTVVGYDGHYRVSRGTGHHPVTGLPIEVMRREFMEEDGLLTLNTEERNSRDTKRWGEGAGSEKKGNVPFIRIARTPMNIFFDRLAPRITDRDHMKWWLGKDEALPFRTKSGNL